MDLQKNDPLPEPIITPTTKARDGGHDERLSSAEVTERGLVDPEPWAQTCDAAIALFQRGQQIAHDAGLILVDTKYEFGVDAAGALTLIDEVHTPDSSRYWKLGHATKRAQPAAANRKTSTKNSSACTT